MMPSKLNILLLEDRAADAELIERELREAGIAAVCQRVQTEPEFTIAIYDSKQDLILSDYSLPSFDGQSALALARKACPDTPFIFVSGEIGEDVAIAALHRGATDYVLKNRLSRLAPAVRRAMLEVEERKNRRAAETALRASEAFASRIIESSLDMIIASDLERRIIRFNRAAEETFGYQASEVLGKPVSMLYADPGESGTVHQQLLGSGRCEMELLNRRKNGEVFPCLISASILRSDDGRTVGYMGISRDVTERKRAEEALREEQLRLELASQASHIGPWDWDLRTNQVFLSEEWKKQIGFAAHEIGNRYEEWESRLHPEDRDSTLAALQAYLAGERPEYEVEFRLRHKDGAYRWIYTRGKALLDAAGKRYRMLGCHVDITERKKSELALRESEERFAKAFHSNPLGICISTLAEGRFIDANETFLRMFRYTRDEVIGHTSEELKMWPDQADRQKIIRKLTERGSVLNFEHAFRRKNGALGQALASVEVVELGGEKCGLSLFNDITEKKLWEANALRTQRLESIGTLAGGIAHDLNNILAPILMSAQILEMKGLDATSQELVARIITSAERGADVVKQVLTFARGAQGERMPLQPQHLIQDMYRIVRETFPKMITASVRAPADLWLINADATQIHQVLLNLCVNARDAMSQGGLLSVTAENVWLDELSAASMPGAATGPYLRIQVQDTGTGMTPQVRERIFDLFFTTKEPGKGTGLGLSTALGIVRSHGGFIEVQSEMGRGSCFKVYLPASQEALAPSLASPSKASPAGSGECILVVDDERSILDVTHTILSRFGYQVIMAESGPEAVAFVARNPGKIKLVISDMMMPHMEGHVLIQALKRLEPELRIISSSGMDQEIKMEQLRPLGVTSFLSKPYKAEALLEAVHAELRKGTSS